MWARDGVFMLCFVCRDGLTVFTEQLAYLLP